MKKIISLLAIIIAVQSHAQKIDSIFFNLYTDSVKKGAMHFNYINVDGKLSNGSYIPLDSTHVVFTSSAGRMTGNVLVLDSACRDEYVIITATLRSNPGVRKEIRIYVKKFIPEAVLPTEKELIEGWRRAPSKKSQ